jgi:hypothetical protein
MTGNAAPRFSARTLTAVADVITGDPIKGRQSRIAPYRSGPLLVRFFNEHGANDSYGQGFPTRFNYAEEKLRSYNRTTAIVGVIEAAVDPLHFLNEQSSVDEAVSYLNNYLKRDGFELVNWKEAYRLQRAGEQLVEIDARVQAGNSLTQEFIDEQVSKCRRKIRDEDYDGAITNARSLVEAVLFDIEYRLTGVTPVPDGDLLRQYKTVQRGLNLDPARADISNSLKQVLTGLTSIVAGIAPLRNRMSDAHARTHKPARHHAKLVINAAHTLADFLFETFEYQLRRGLVTESPDATASAAETKV